jgi:hypothetical protein
MRLESMAGEGIDQPRRTQPNSCVSIVMKLSRRHPDCRDNGPIATEFVTAESKDKIRPFVFVVGGETAPMLDRGASGPPPAGQAPSAGSGAAGGPLLLYEYWWTLANFDSPSPSGAWAGRDRQGHRISLTPRASQRESGEVDRVGFAGYTAQIEMLFPTAQGWLCRDRAAAVRYLTPLPDDLREELAKDWQDLTPVIEGASKVAAAASSFTGPAAAETAKTLAALAQVKCNSVPQAALPWSVTSIAASTKDGMSEGVAWTLSEALLERLGGRVMGSVVVSVVPAALQGGSSTPGQASLRGSVELYRDGEHVPSECQPSLPLELHIKPR